MTCDKQIRLYEEKLEKIKKDNEGKEKRKEEREKMRLKKRTRGARKRGGSTRMTNQRTQRHPIKTCGGKQGSFFRPADQETKDQHK